MRLSWLVLSKASKKLKLHCIPTSSLDQATLKDVHNIACQNLIGKTEYNDFIKFLNQFDYTLLMCDDRPASNTNETTNKATTTTTTRGAIRGMGAYTVIPAVLENNKKCYILRPALAFVQKEYREQGILFKISNYFLTKERLCRPFSKLYLISPFLSYKLYQTSCNHSKTIYPRYDSQTPEEEQSVIDYYVSLINNDTNIEYQRGIIRLQHSIKEEIGAVSEKDIHDPHVKYYLKKNPNWVKGDALVIVQKITWKEIIVAILKGLLKSLYVR